MDSNQEAAMSGKGELTMKYRGLVKNRLNGEVRKTRWYKTYEKAHRQAESLERFSQPVHPSFNHFKTDCCYRRSGRRLYRQTRTMSRKVHEGPNRRKVRISVIAEHCSVVHAIDEIHIIVAVGKKEVYQSEKIRHIRSYTRFGKT